MSKLVGASFIAIGTGGIALALPILTLCSFLPFIGVLAGIANLVLFILFWVKTAEYKEKLRKTLTRTVVL
jgi:hypothetical protein